jgi:predicted metal-dependent phosphoesterase TrpH
VSGKRADLHIHSTHSDGTLTPAEIVRLAKESGLAAVSVTDHDNIAGVSEAQAAGDENGVEVVPGVELSANEDGTDIHMLGYLIDVQSESLIEHLGIFRERRRVRAERMVEKLNKLGLDVSIEAVLAKAGTAAIGRPHVAEALAETGLVSSYEEVFRKYIGYGGPAYEPKYVISPERSVEIVHSAGGLAVVAHPGVYIKEEMLQKILKSGVDGIESMHPKHTAETVDRLSRLAKDLGLVETGGSDFHGDTRGNTAFGGGTVPYEWVENLREVAARKREGRGKH